MCKALIYRVFATSSESTIEINDGNNPVKLYNSSNVLIYQVDNGGNNIGKLPSGGVLVQSSAASSMSATVANPITIYGVTFGNVVIDQVGQSGDLYNYYWTSYSRGTDGQIVVPLSSNTSWHNLYLDSYIPLRHKSIYDPCPYGYRIPSNGTYNQFTNTGWIRYSYIGGVIFNNSWFSGTGHREFTFCAAGVYQGYRFAQRSSQLKDYSVVIYSTTNIIKNHLWQLSAGISVRCIEECEILTDATISKRELKIKTKNYELGEKIEIP